MSKNTELARIARIVLDEVFTPGAEHELKKQQVITKNAKDEKIHESRVSYSITGFTAVTKAQTRISFMQLTGAVKVVRTSSIPFTEECFTLVIPNGTSPETIVVMIDAFAEFMAGTKKVERGVGNTVSMARGKSITV